MSLLNTEVAFEYGASSDSSTLRAERSFVSGAPVIAAASLLGLALIAFATRNGIGLSVDSAFYVSVARELAAGHGLTVPWGTPEPTAVGTRWAPLMPAVLAGIAKLGFDPVHSVRWVNAVCLACTSGICGFTIFRSTRSLTMGIVVSLLVVTSQTMLAVFSMAWSEPIFILCSTCAVVLMAGYIRSRRTAYLVAAFLAILAACLTRYAGASWIIAAFGCLLLQPGRWRFRALAAGCAALMAFVPMYPGGPTWITWMNTHQGGTTDDATLAPALEVLRIREGLDVITNWLWPWGLDKFKPEQIAIQAAIAAIVAVILAFIGVSSWRTIYQRQSTTSKRVVAGGRTQPGFIISGEALGAACGLFVVAYFALIIAAVGLFGRTVSFTPRIMLPLMPLAIMMLAIGWRSFQRRRRFPKWVTVSCVTICTLIIGVRAAGAFDYCDYISAGHGCGAQNYQQASWQSSPTVRAMEMLPQDATIYSNAPDAIYLLTERNAIWLSILNEKTGMSNQVDVASKPASAAPAYIVYFNRLSWRPSSPQRDELAVKWPLSEVISESDGAIFKFREVVSCSEMLE